MSERLRFGIVGCGMVGAIHAAALASLADAQLVAVTGRTLEKAHKLAEQYQARAYSNVQEMLEREHLDVVNICTPSGMHAGHAILAMRAGCHVMVEKPMEITLARVDEMLHVQRETGRKLAVMSQHRFDAASQRVRELIEQKALGKIVLANASIPWWRSQHYYESGKWRGTWALDGGGVLMNQSIHSIDLLQWLVGPVKTVYAFTDTLAHKMETEDTAVAVLRFASGALGTIAATTGAYPGVTTRIEIYGNQGSAVIDNDRLAYVQLARDEQAGSGSLSRDVDGDAAGSQGASAQDPGALAIETHAMQMADMVRAIRTDGTPLLDGYGARHPVAIILGIYESARTRREVKVA